MFRWQLGLQLIFLELRHHLDNVVPQLQIFHCIYILVIVTKHVDRTSNMSIILLPTIIGYGSMKDIVLLWRFHGCMYDGVTIAKVLAYALGTPSNIDFRPNSHYFNKWDHIIKVCMSM